jgi:hypothetical protein
MLEAAMMCALEAANIALTVTATAGTALLGVALVLWLLDWL